MGKLSLRGFLAKYLRELSGLERLNLARLALLADGAMPRIRAPLVVYAYIRHPSDVIESLFANTSSLEEYSKYFSTNPKLTNQFFNELPEEYKKLYQSYILVRDEGNIEKHIKALYRDKIIEIQKSNNISTYTIAKALNINHGNLYAFLHQEKIKSICINKVRAIYEHLQSQDTARDVYEQLHSRNQ